MADSVRITEVGPRDGLQNESIAIPTTDKLAFIERLIASGLKTIEATSFVSPKWVPQMGDAAELWPNLPDSANFSALVPNMRGLQSALSVGCKRIALFTAASDAFTQKNINMTVEESLNVFTDVMAHFRDAVPGGWVRAYVSTIFECPYAGRVSPTKVAEVVSKLAAMGVDEVSLGDTIGVGTPTEVRAVTAAVSGVVDLSRLNYHFHDTRGTAIANVACALDEGIRSFDASAAGLGGCPYAKGASGNVATEDLIYFLEREGVHTGVDLTALSQASLPILELLGKPVTAKAQRAALAAL